MSTATAKPMKTWRTVCLGVESYVSATTRSKARYSTYLSATEAYSKKVVQLHQVQVWRAPEFDAITIVRCCSKAWAEGVLAEHLKQSGQVIGRAA